MGTKDELKKRNNKLFLLFNEKAIEIMNAHNKKSVELIVLSLRDELSTFTNFGYITIDNMIQLASFCGVIPAICYTIKQLPKAPTSGSNRFITDHLKADNSRWDEKQRLFDKTTKLIKECTSSRIYASDIENGMCEISRERRNRRKKESIFWDKSCNKLQHFYRIHKTNISKHTSVMKYQVQVFQQYKWVCVQNNITLMYETWNLSKKNDSSKKKFGLIHNSATNVMTSVSDITFT